MMRNDLHPTDSARRRRACCLLLLAVLALGSCATPEPPRERLDLTQQETLEESLDRLERRMLEAPQNMAFRADYLRERERAVNFLLVMGERARAQGTPDAAEAFYRRVLGIDADNAQARAGLTALRMAERHAAQLAAARLVLEDGNLEAARAQLQPVLLENPAHAEALVLRREIDTQLATRKLLAPPVLQSKFKQPVSLQFRDANLKMVFDALSRTSGINILLDRDVNSDLKTTIFVKDASIEDAIDVILMQSQLEKKVLNENTVFIYPATPSKLKEYQDLVIRTFHLTNADAKQMQAMIKTVLKTKDVFIHEKTNSLVMRDTPDAVQMAEKLLAAQDLNEPEVMLEVEVLEVLHSKLVELGLKWPDQVGFSITDNPVSPTTIIGPGGAIQTTTPPAEPLTLEGLRNLDSSIIRVTPLSWFLNLRKDLGDTNLLASPRIRVRQHDKAKILIGDRVPVITNSVTPLSTGTPVVTGSVQYLDVGLKLEVEPDIHMDGEVAINTFLEVSTIAREVTNSASGTVAYQIGTRTASTVLRLKDGETQVLAGLINDEERKAAAKVPGLGDLPLVGRLFSSHKDEARKTEIILAITPHIIRNQRRPDAELLAFWSGTDAGLRSKPLTLETMGMIKAAIPAALAQAAPGTALAPRPLPPVAAPAAAPTAAPKAAALAAAPLAPVTLTWQGAAQARVGEQFRVAIAADSSAALGSVPLIIDFDPEVLQVMDVAEGDLLKRNNAQTAFTRNIDQEGGQITLEVARSAADGVTGKGNVAVLTFRVLGPQAKSQLTLSTSAPLDASGAALGFMLPAPHTVTLGL